jgi:hypothetical protein
VKVVVFVALNVAIAAQEGGEQEAIEALVESRLLPFKRFIKDGVYPVQLGILLQRMKEAHGFSFRQ